MDNKKASFVLTLVSLACSLFLLGFWIKFAIQSQQNVQKTQQAELEACENLAQAYTRMPWTLEQIDVDIDQKMNNGILTSEVGAWLKNRVYELRNP